MSKLIITASLTGSDVVPSQSPYLPITPDEIAQEAVRCREAGAAIVHIHARQSHNGHPTSDPQVFREIAGKIKAKTDLVICVTTGGGFGMTVQERAAVVPELKPEMASLSLGSMNFGLFPSAKRIEEFRFDWEKEFLEGTRDFVFKNTFSDIEGLSEMMAQEETKPELEIYDVGHLYNLSYLVRKGNLKLPVHLQFVMGVMGGISNSLDDFLHLKRTSDRLFGDNYTWSVIGIGYPAAFQLGAVACMLGGHVRVGMEDNLRITKDSLAKSNAELVDRMARLAKELDREPAKPEEVRKILGLKGLDKVNF